MVKLTGVYMLWCVDKRVKKRYIGSTDDLSLRLSKHKYECNTTTRTHYNYEVYKFIRSKGGWDNWNCDLLAECPNWNKTELASLEQVYKDVMKPALNMNNALCPNPKDIVECDNCNKMLKYGSLRGHKKSKKCLNFNK